MSYVQGETFMSQQDISNYGKEYSNAINSGRIWTQEDLSGIVEALKRGNSWQHICRTFGRSMSSVASKLKDLGYLEYNSTTNSFFVLHNHDLENPMLINKTDTSTNAEVIKTVVFIQGRDASTFSDDQIFALIADLEQQAASLASIKHQPNKLKDRIAAIHADIAKLVEFVDAR